MEQLIEGSSFVPMIMSEMIRSLSYCSSHKHGIFFGCAALLQVWVLEHLADFQSIRVRFLFQDLIHRHVTGSSEKEMIESKEEWVAYFCSLPFDKIVWKVEWLQTSSAILHCPGHHFVPLLGLRGMAVYTPFRVLRQFGMVQVIPVVEDLSDWFFDFGTAEEIGKLSRWHTLVNPVCTSLSFFPFNMSSPPVIRPPALPAHLETLAKSHPAWIAK